MDAAVGGGIIANMVLKLEEGPPAGAVDCIDGVRDVGTSEGGSEPEPVPPETAMRHVSSFTIS